MNNLVDNELHVFSKQTQSTTYEIHCSKLETKKWKTTALNKNKNKQLKSSKLKVFKTDTKTWKNHNETYGHKKRSTAVLQPLLTLNLIL